MRRSTAFLPPFLCLLLAATASAETLSADEPIGFFPASRDALREAEATFLAEPTPAKMRGYLMRLTEEPHVAGTPAEKNVADYVRAKLDEFGLDTEVVEMQVYLNHPREVAARLVEPVEEELALIEDFVDGDKDTTTHTMFPGFHGYGASGKVRGQVVYVNYGTAADFRRLADLGVDVRGKIALARYGRVFRGLKVREAQNAGARGILIFSDPADDGYARGDVYPDGPMRPPTAIQRGSVQFLSIQPGDPSTPGWPSVGKVRRLTRSEMETVPRIPSLPLSYREAEKVLRRLAGPVVPDGWQGGLPFAYHLGPGGAAVEMEVEMDEGLMPIYNVFGRIRGSEEPQRVIILGNHRDAWNHGAVDPNSGTAAWLETARALAVAREAGWQPRRTIVFASWDAEEYGLVGSVEWGEANAQRLRADAVAYLNVDAAVTGEDLGVGGTPSLRDLVREVAARVPEPLRGGSVGEAWEKRLHGEWAKDAVVDLADPDADFELHLPPLGSGSDYTVFVDHLGVPAIDFGFRGKYGVYHSLYDTFDWMDRFGDPRFVYHQAAARFYGLLAMRLATADVVPLTFDSYAAALRRNLDELQRTAIRNRRGSADAPAFDFAPVLTALEDLAGAGGELRRAVDAAVERGDASVASRLNPALIAIERHFLDDEGLPGRPWFKHLLDGPGKTTGYAPWPFPELTEAVEDGDAELFERGRLRVVAALTRASAAMRDAVALAAPPS